MSAILLLLHLLPPSAQGRKRPGKMSASQAVEHLIKFLKVCWTVVCNMLFITSVSCTMIYCERLVTEYCCLMFDCRLEPVYSSISTTSATAASLTSSLRGLREAASTPSSLSSTSMHYHVRQQVQWEPLTNSLRPITSLVPRTVLPLLTFSLFCKQLSTTLALGKQRKLPELLNCEQE